MSIAQWVRQLQQRDVQFALVDGKLKVSAPAGVLDVATLDLLRQRKPEIVEMLQATQPDATDAPVLRAIPRAARMPCSPAQQRLWLVQQASGHGAAYNLPAALRLRGALDIDALRSALAAIVQRHEVLRSCFPVHEGQPMQCLLAADDPRLAVVLEAINVAEAEIAARFDAHAAHEFDLAEGPLVDARLLRIDASDHVLLLNMHHIVADGWSTGVLVNELCAGYRAACAGRTAALPALPIQYVDYAAWQRELLATGVLSRQRDYWQQRLAGSSGQPILPTDHLRPAQLSQRGAHQELAIPPPLVRRLRELAQSERASMYMLLLAAFQLQLSRLAGERDVVVGAPVANRARPELEPLIGFFVNTLVLRTRIDAAQSFRQLLRAVREQTLQDFAHQDLPFEHLVEILKPARSPSYSPLFQVAFTLESGTAPAVELPGLQVETVVRAGRYAKFDLTLALVEGADDIVGSFEYAADLFEAATVGAWSADFIALLGDICDEPDRMLALLGRDNRREVAARIGFGIGPPRDPRADLRSLPALLAQHACERPQALALADARLRLTFAELDRKANGLALRLRALGLASEARVGVCLPRSPAAVVAMLAAWKAGAVWVPLDPSFPEARLQYFCDDAGLACVIGDTSTAALCANLSPPLLRIDGNDDDVDVIAAPPAMAQVAGAHMAYIIYTSGSTGAPKGAMIEHAALRRLVDWYAQQSGMAPGSRHSQMAQFGFDAMVVEIWGPLAAGASVHFVDSEVRLHPRQLAAWLDAEDINAAFMPTPLAEEFLASGASMPGKLARICCGGDRLKHYALPEGPRVLNCYGPTEATVISLAAEVPVTEGAVIAIGRPLPETSAYVLDTELQPAGIGQAGELYVAGALLGRGYYGRSGLTAERFMPDPFSTIAGARMYRTGDRARWMPCGELEFLGRADTQVKLRGFRIELGEIETVLAQQSGVGDAAAVLSQTPSGAPALVGYVTAAEAQQLDLAELRRALMQRLPNYMVPTLLQFVEVLPLLPSGKVNRNALPTPLWAGLADEAVAPRDAQEQALLEEWRDLLGIAHIGVRDDFFTLGGHSLLATRLLACIHRRFGAELTLAALFNSPTIEQLSALITAAASMQPGQRLVKVPRGQGVPLSFAQQRLWFLAQLEPDSDAYHMPVLLHLKGEVDVSALVAAVADVVERHEVLRARFAEVAGEPRQHFDRYPAALQLQVLAPDELGLALRDFVATRFDLSKDAVLRSRLFRVGEQAHILALVVHHIVADGWSMHLISRDLADCYTARRAGAARVPPPLELQYGDYAHWQRRTLDEAALAQGLTYWAGHLADMPGGLDLPLDAPRSAHSRGTSASASLQLDRALVTELRQFTQARGATLFMGLLTVLKVLLARLSGQDDICVGTPIANRARAELEPMVGLFLGTLAMRTVLDHGNDFEAALARVRTTAVAAYENQHVPFERIVDALKLGRCLDRHPLFQVFFNMIELEQGATPSLPGLEVSSLMPPEQQSKFDFTLYANTRGDEIGLQLHFNAALFSVERMDGMLRQFQALLRQVLHAPTAPLLHHSLRTEADLGRLPDPALPLQAQWQGAITTWFARRCAEHPRRVAALDDQQTLTFEELDQASNRLAHWLRAQDVGEGDVVALHSSRCAAIAVGVLGVLKAGAAFMMLDAAYPHARLEACIDIAEPKAWLHVGEHEVSADLQECLARRVPRRMRLDHTLSSLRAWPIQAPPEPSIDAHSLSHIAFTSGSSGRPKAIAGRHGPFTQFLAWFQREFAIGAEDRYSVLSGLAHDPLQRDVLWPLMLGGTACFPNPELMIPGALAKWMREKSITVANLTPAMSRVLADADAGTTLQDLRRAFIVGDVLTRDVVRKLHDLAPNCSAVAFYGATETQWALAFEPADVHADGAVVALGRGFPGVQLLLLNSAGAVAGVGELAEICIRSPHLAHGYWRDAPATAERFVEKSFDGGSKERLYRTGDLGRYLPDGRVRGVGRVDRQVSVRGYRVELGEIEAVLAAHPAIRHAVVAGRRESDVGAGVSALHAFVVARADMAAELPALHNELKRRLQDALPDHMQPLQIEFLQQVPLNANGKVDYRALLQLTCVVEPQAVASRPLHGEHERCVARIFSEILQREVQCRDDHFFELGGNSLLAMRVVSRLRDAFERMVPVRLIFERPTVAALAAALTASVIDSAAGLSAIPTRNHSDPAPLSFAQQRLWFLDKLDESASTYNMLLPVRLRGELQADALARALSALVERHEILRTLFVAQAGVATQQILSASTGMVLDRVPCAERDLSAAVDAFAAQPFVLDRAPAIRACLFKVEPELHVLAISMHHIISDGWSMGVLAHELSECYRAACANRDPQLPALPLQFADFSAWQREHQQDDAHRRFWQEYLADSPPLLELPWDRPRPAQQSHRGDKLPLRIDGVLFRSLQALCHETSTTPFMLLMAVWQVLLARLAGCQDISIGFPVAGRDRESLEPLIGLFANTLVLRTRPVPGLSFRDYLADVRTHSLEVFAHQDLPFESMVELVQPQRSLAHTPLFQVMFNLQNMAEIGRRMCMEEVEVEAFSRGQEAARFDLTLVLCEAEQSWFGDLEFCTALFDRDTIAAMIERYLGLLAAVTANPDTWLDQLPMLTQAERARLARGDVATPALPLQRAVEYWARVAPTQMAVVKGAESLDYAQLNAEANRLAHWLCQRGVGVEQRVALMMPRTPDAVVAMLAVLKSGAAFLPIDPATPVQRIQQMLTDAAASLLLVQGAIPAPLAEQVDVADLTVLRADDAFLPMPDSDLDLPVHPQQLAYAIYTSGSTGVPKAAMLNHAGWSNLVAAQARMHEVDTKARVLQLVSSAFDVAAGDIALALSQGATLVLAPDDARRDPDVLQHVLRESRVSHVQMPVSLLASLSLDPLSDLRVLVAGGEAMPAAVVTQWAGQLALFNAYGPTETTVMATCARLRHGAEISIGHAIDGVRIYILDAQLQPVADGVRGEIWIAGQGLGRGYLHRPAMTAAAFLPDPFSDIAGQRMYRSGDLGCWRRDGQLVIHGRTDEQVKVRGYRIELGEVEAALRRCAGVDEAVVSVRSLDNGNRQLVAYIVCAGDAALIDIRREAESELMSYMQPAAWVVLPALPKTANGKIDRRALPAPSPNSQRVEDWEQPRSPAAAALSAVWCRLLGRDQVPVHDSFFDLGGDSILSIRAIALLADMGWKISTRQMYEHQSIARLAAVAKPIGLPVADEGPVSGELQLSPIQHWFFDQVDVAPERWNQSVLLTPATAVTFEIAAAAVLFLQRHHDALRMRVQEDADARRTWLPGDQQVSVLEQIVIDAADEHAFEPRLMAHAERIQGEFSFDGGALFRAVWFEDVVQGRRRLWLLAHHLLIDAVSWRIVLSDLDRLMRELAHGERPGLPARSASVLVWSQRLQAHSRRCDVHASLDYWCETLALPVADLGAREETDLDGDTVKATVELEEDETRQLLEQCAQAYATGINDLLLTAVAIAFAHWRGGTAVRLALESHGRDLPFEELDLTRAVGWFTASYPVVLQLPDSAAIGARIMAIKAQLREVPHAGLSYGLLRYLACEPRLCALTAEVGEAPISFNYLGQFDERAEGDGGMFEMATEMTGRSRHPEQRRPHAIDIVGLVSSGQLVVDFRYGRKRLDGDLVRQFASDFLAALREIIAHCRERAAALLDHTHADIEPAHAAELALVPLRADGEEAALFCVHPAGGSVDCYRALVTALDQRMPVYGLQAPSLAGQGPLLHSFPDMAALYVAAIRHQQPHGPYRLLGWSQGGTIAYEIACQLERLGETVECLFLVDTGQSKQMLRKRAGIDESDELLEYLQEQGFAEDVASGGMASRFETLVAKAQQQQLLPAGMGSAQVRAILATQRAIAQATATFEPSPYLGRVVLLRAEDDHLFGHLGERLGWAPELCADWRCVDVPGDHFACVQSPHVHTLATHLLTLLHAQAMQDGDAQQAPLDGKHAHV